LKLSQVQKGKNYKVESFIGLNSLARRVAVLGLNTGAIIEMTALYNHGALIKTNMGSVAIGRDLLEMIRVTSDTALCTEI